MLIFWLNLKQKQKLPISTYMRLEKIIKRKIDLLTPNALSEYFRDKVLETAQVIYEAND